jgi:hypothetical protein
MRSYRVQQENLVLMANLESRVNEVNPENGDLREEK